MNTSLRTTSLRLPEDLIERFDRLAEATERTRSYHFQKALEAYIAEREWLVSTVRETLNEAAADTRRLTNDEVTARLIEQGLLQPEDLDGPDPVSDEEYEAAQHQPLSWRP
ncbi:MAG TPA: ribbon-helix-helix domain-containing protein [Chloroflexota bacterium]|nr:ribbon-helix-helix domain-containing protein [Chloroflexota bacterium]